MDENNKPLETTEVSESSRGFKLSAAPIVAIVAVVACLVAGIVFLQVQKNPTNVFKKAINNAYKDFSDGLKEYKKMSNDFDIKKDTLSVSGDLSVSGSLYDLNDIKDDKIEFSAAFNYGEQELLASAKLKEGKDILADGAVYLVDDKGYLKSESLLDSTVDLGEMKFSEMFDLEDVLEEMEEIEIPSTEDIEFVVKEVKDALIDSLNKENMTVEKEEIEINDKTVKANKISYELNKNSVKDLGTTFADKVLENDKLIKKLAEITDTEKSDIKDAFKELKEKDNYEDFDGKGTFSIYTTGITNSIVKYELKFESVTISYTENKGDFELVVSEKESEMKFVVTGVKEKDETEVTVKLNKEKIATLNVRQFDNEAIDFDYSIEYDDNKVSGTVKVTAEQEKKSSKISGVIEFSCKYEVDGEKEDIAVKMNYEIDFDGEIKGFDTKKAVTEPTEADQTKLEAALEKIEDSKIYKFMEDSDIADIFESKPVTPSYPSYPTIIDDDEDDDFDIYDDDECWDAYYEVKYEKETYDGYYSDYYDEYCR